MTGRLVLIEGIPGAGKSTLASQLARELRAEGQDAFWVTEEAPDHPVIPRALRRRNAEPDFPQECLRAWRSFVERNRRVAVLEGVALQSTVRFMFAHELSRKRVVAYFTSFARVVAGAEFRYLEVADPAAHYERVTALRGEEWTHKVAEYVAATLHGRRHGLRGAAGLVRFWADYQEYCLALLGETGLGVRVERGEAS